MSRLDLVRPRQQQLTSSNSTDSVYMYCSGTQIYLYRVCAASLIRIGNVGHLIEIDNSCKGAEEHIN